MWSRWDALPPTRALTREWWRDGFRGYQEAHGDAGVRTWCRLLARNDLFFLLVVALQRQDVDRDWLFDRCREVQADPNGCVDLWAREHYKSTIITYGLTIQDVLASHGDDPEVRFNGREVTVGIFSHTAADARKFLLPIKQEFEANNRLRGWFADVLWERPESQAPQWSLQGGLVVRRRSNPKEATVSAWGLVDKMPTGSHYLARIYDDVVTERSVTTPEQIRKATDAFRMSDNLGTAGGYERVIGTRYHQHDAYGTMIDEMGYPARIRPATSDGSEDTTRAVLMTPEALAEKRTKQGRYIFGCQMLQNPVADKSQTFDREWLRYWEPNDLRLNKYIIVDPAHAKKKESDYTAMWVVGVGGDENYYVLDLVRDKLGLIERRNMLFQLHRRWRPVRVGYEQYGLQADIEACQEEMERVNYRFAITPLGGRMPKPDRIRRLMPLFEAGRVYLPHSIIRPNWEGRSVDVIRAFVRDEYCAFPVCATFDMLDALARIVDDSLGVMAPEPEPEAFRLRPADGDRYTATTQRYGQH